MSKGNNSSTGGIGFVGLLTIAFIVLKLCGVIGWSWFWVLSPIWISTGVALGLVLGLFVLAVIKDLQKDKARKEKKHGN